MEDIDAELFLRFKTKRDKEAFAQLVKRWQKPLINFFYRLCWRQDLAEDLAQDTFIHLIKAAPKYKPKAKFNTFLFKIARNLWIDKLKISQDELGEVISLDNPIDENQSLSLSNLLTAKGPRPDEIVTAQETLEMIKKMMLNLPEEHQMVLNLCIFEGMNYQEVAEVLDIPEGTVKSRLHWALIKLKDLIKP